MAVDALNIHWGNLGLAYAFPPFSLVFKVLRKVQSDVATVILIAPVWKSQAWYPKVLNMLFESPVLLPQSWDLLFLPHNRRPHPLLPDLMLAAWPISGDSCRVGAFRQGLQTSSSRLGEKDRRLCAFTYLKEYLRRTSSLRKERGGEQKLFISYRRPHRPVGSATLARWVKSVLGTAGVDTATFSAHSTRGASTSAAAAAGVSLHSIMKAADWSRESTFLKYYRRDNNQHTFGQAVLSTALKESIGVRLLRKMGWRDGTGIGAKVRRKIKMKRQAEVAPSQKLYGCAPPPGHRHSEEEEDEDDPFTHGHEFAPKDVLPMSYQPKDNMHGIGYRGLVPTDFLGPSMSTARLGPKSKGMKGQAFGVGVFEEEDDDIYTTDSMANYDFTAAGVEVETQSQLKQTRHGHQMPSIETKAPEGFVLSRRAAQPKQVFPPPAVPRDFRPVHRFSRPAEGELQTAGRHSLTALQRAQALGEKPPTEQMSVFDLISTADKEAIKTVQLHKNVTAVAPVPPVAPAPPAPPAVHTDRQSATTTTGNMGNFRPFSRDAAKQQRYEEYIRAAKSGAKDPMPAAPSGMTEWERDREREEFVRAYQLYQPLHGMMASRFTRGKHLDQPTTDQPPSLQEEVSDKAKAAGMKMFGRLTRDRMEWHPDRLLCRRFNVPNPYPESTVVGLCTLKKEKYTFANFLNMPVESSSSTTTNSKGKETPESQEVSKNTSKVAGGEERGVLSYLCESEDVPSTSEQDTRMQEDPDVSKKLDTDKEKPPLDLFKAIFQSSSDSSGGSDDSEEGEDMDDTRGDGGESKEGGGEARGLGGKRVEVDNSDGALEQDRDKPLDNITADPADTGKLDSDPKLSVVTSPDSHVSRWDRSEAQVTVEQAQVTVEQAQGEKSTTSHLPSRCPVTTSNCDLIMHGPTTNLVLS
ncbi:G patch domain-containing protein 1 [Branchiostoma belcheri]|nr:G patch domain-containing protein 1 [Branchiostoma belcheri]